MTILKLSETEKYKKFNALRKAGLEVIVNDKGVKLVDNKCNADKYIDTYFNSIDEVLKELSGFLLKSGIIVTI